MIAVATALAAVAVSDIWYIARYSLRTPYWDDWNLIPVAAGRMPITAQWLWALQEDHRIALPKLLFVMLYRLGQGDVRAIAFVNSAILCMVAALGILVVRRRRGFTRFSDLLIPLALAGIANYSNLVSANQIQYISSIGLFCLAVCLILWQENWFMPRTSGIVGVCVLLLPLTGSTGVVLAFPLVVLLACGAYLNHRSQEPDVKRASRVAGILGTTSLAILAAYAIFADRRVSPVLSASADLKQFLVGTLQFAGVGFTAPPIVPTSTALDWVQRLWPLRSLLVVIAAGYVVVGLISAARQGRDRLTTVLAPLACMASVVVLAVVIGFERGSALEQRYIILGATLLFTTYLCLSLVKQRAAAVAGWVLALTAVILLPWNAYYAIRFGESRRAFEANLVRDIRAGVPVDLLGTRYYPDIWGDPMLASGAIRQMRDFRIGPFASGDLQLNDSPPPVSGEAELGTAPVAVHNMTPVGEYWQGTGADSFLLYSIGGRKVAGVRLTYTLSNTTERPAYLQLNWSEAPGGDLEAKKFVVWGAPANDQPHQTVAWIGDNVDMLKITPDTQATLFKMDSIELLLSQ